MSTLAARASLALVPQEVLEHIAFFAATEDVLGPPTGLMPLLVLSRQMHAALSSTTNPHLYARIFAHKFDLAPAVRRFGEARTSAGALTEELQKRCIFLKRMKLRSDTITKTYKLDADHEEMLRSILWTAYLMVLENDGLNERQLREYADIDSWLKEYWLHPSGASLAKWSVKVDLWPPSNERTSLAMWLFWFLLKPDEFTRDESVFRESTGILKLVALGAHQYPLCYPTWNEYAPRYRPKEASYLRHYSFHLSVTPPAPAAPAILAYLTLVNKLSVSWEALNYMRPLAPTVPSTLLTRDSYEWDGEWARARFLGDPCRNFGTEMSGAFKPGSLEGVWEGLFTYTEFTAYAALLAGAPPTVLQRGLVAQHRQTWKLREHHLYAVEDEDVGLQPDSLRGDMEPLSPGNPCRGYVPNGTDIVEGSSGLVISETGRRKPIIYQSWSSTRTRGVSGKIKDVFITGEGHSAWGQFNLIGRVRPCDGFFNLSKEYSDGDRGKWIYRGYMVGNTHGNLSGRWRDTLSPSHVPGYEGCFVMSRRQ